MNVTRSFRFDASHIVPDYPGICSKLHGHTFCVEVSLLGDPKDGIIVTPAYVKSLVSPIITRLNGEHLNYLMKLPTVENVALYIAHELLPLSCENLSSIKVSVPSLMTYEWSTVNKDDELFLPPIDTYKAKDRGWLDAFDPIPAFSSHSARAKWVNECIAALEATYARMTEIGAQLAAFERYRASLDMREAEKLAAALRDYEQAAEVVEKTT